MVIIPSHVNIIHSFSKNKKVLFLFYLRGRVTEGRDGGFPHAGSFPKW